MFHGKSVTVIVPAFNEERLIGRVLDTMPRFVDHVVVVDDASVDGTARVVKRRARRDRRIVLIRHEGNRGVGGALASGYEWAARRNSDIAAVMAGDGQMDPEDLPSLIGPVARGDADYCKGNRLFTGEAFEKIPKIRYLGNAVLSMLTKIASGYWHVADSQCGYTAIGSRALKTIPWKEMYRDYGQPNDLLVRLNVFNFKVVDVPVTPVYGRGEKSGIRIPVLIPRLSWLLLKRFIWRMKEKYVVRDFHPLVFFYFFGALLFFPGLLLGFYLFIYWLFIGDVTPLSALFAMFLTVTGLQLLLFAMWFDMEYNRAGHGSTNGHR
ncbi:glycosyltransferase [bacterium]|nr:glycosyltransferase [bacterium]